MPLTLADTVSTSRKDFCRSFNSRVPAAGVTSISLKRELVMKITASLILCASIALAGCSKHEAGNVTAAVSVTSNEINASGASDLDLSSGTTDNSADATSIGNSAHSVE